MNQLLFRFVTFHVAAEIIRHLKMHETFEELNATLVVDGMAALVGIEDETHVCIEGVVF